MDCFRQNKFVVVFGPVVCKLLFLPKEFYVRRIDTFNTSTYVHEEFQTKFLREVTASYVTFWPNRVSDMHCQRIWYVSLRNSSKIWNMHKIRTLFLKKHWHIEKIGKCAKAGAWSSLHKIV